ncbi:hypothetical protein MXB_3410, partial [Myxobolus squamalis]
MERPTSQFQEVALATHNQLRALHGAPALEWSNDLAKSSLEWAKELAKSNVLAHGDSNDGENLAFISGIKLDGEYATKMWYNEISDYDYSTPKFSSKTGHFTQLIWAGSKKFGIANFEGKNGSQFIVARYLPPGNFQGRFELNVKPLLSQPMNSLTVPSKPLLIIQKYDDLKTQ